MPALIEAGKRFSVDFFISSAGQMVDQAAPFLTETSAVFVNAVEYALLADVVPSQHLRLIVISDGARPVRILRRGRLVARVRPPQTDAVEVTGAGDTLAGTFLAALAAGSGDGAALRQAVTAAAERVRLSMLVLEDG